MTTPQYTPRNPSVLDNIRYTQNLVDSILRNNPLTDAVVSEGLIRWIGNYTNAGSSDLINLLWIGEFFPPDVNIGPDVPQRGVSLVRDDSNGGISAFALYDHNPGGPGGLNQTIHVTSLDDERLFMESRQGGQLWPEENVAMGPVGRFTLPWIGTDQTSYDTLWEGRVNVVGNNINYRFFGATTNGATGSYRMRIPYSGGTIFGPVHSLGVNTSAVHDGDVDVSAARGETCAIHWEGKRDNAAGEARATVITVRCFSTSA